MTLNDVPCQTEALKSKMLRSLPSYFWGFRGSNLILCSCLSPRPPLVSTLSLSHETVGFFFIIFQYTCLNLITLLILHYCAINIGVLSSGII